MNDDIFWAFGYSGSTLACIMMLPQLYLTYNTQSTKDLSIYTIVLNLCTQCFFFPYSIHFKIYPLVTVNTFLSLCDILLLIMYFKIRRKEYNENKNKQENEIIRNHINILYDNSYISNDLHESISYEEFP